MVGFGDVLQHTPRSVIADPASLVIIPPLIALVVVIVDADFVLRVTISPRIQRTDKPLNLLELKTLPDCQ